VFNYLTTSVALRGLQITAIALSLTLPFAGWLADIRFGRYKVIRWSMWIMWAVSILNTINSIVVEYIPGYQGIIYKGTSVTIIFILAISFVVYQANVIQFGLDQLQDASTTEITAFIIWYVWTILCNAALSDFTHICVTPKYYLFGQLRNSLLEHHCGHQLLLFSWGFISEGTSDTKSRYTDLQSHTLCYQEQASTVQKCLHLL
jgi:hypothetical protein